MKTKFWVAIALIIFTILVLNIITIGMIQNSKTDKQTATNIVKNTSLSATKKEDIQPTIVYDNTSNNSNNQKSSTSANNQQTTTTTTTTRRMPMTRAS